MSSPSRSGGTSDTEEEEERGLRCHDAICVFLAVCVPTTVLIAGFSAVGDVVAGSGFEGMGLQVYGAMAPKHVNLSGNLAVGSGVFVCAVYYVMGYLDWKMWWKAAALSLPWLLFCLGSVLKSRRHPFAPMLMVMLHVAVFLGAIRSTCSRSLHRRTFYALAALAALLCAALSLGLWGSWVAEGHLWTYELKAEFASKSQELYKYIGEHNLQNEPRALVYEDDCGPQRNISSYPSEEQTRIKAACTRASTVIFLVWAAPMLAFLSTSAMFMFVVLTGVKLKLRDYTEKEMALKKFLMAIGVMVMAVYASVSLSGVIADLTQPILAACLIVFLLLMVWAYMELDVHAIQEQSGQSQLMGMLIAAKHSDWVRAMTVGSGFIPAFMVLETLRQRCCCAKRKGGESEDGPAALLAALEKWNWVGILRKVCLLGEVFFFFNVAFSKVTYIFLSWMNNVALVGVDFVQLNVIIFFVGFVMFLLPPVPGSAVYLFVGLVDGQQAKSLPMGFAGGCAVGIVLSFFLKLAACAGQYLIGYSASSSVQVKSAVGVTSVTMRACEKILKTPGCSLGKLAVLVCGPDWPVSVLCGIMRVSLAQMLLGTAPVLFVSIVPTVLAGAFQGSLRPGEESLNSLLASAFMALVAVGQLGGSLVMVQAVTKCVKQHGEELTEEREDHADVKALEQEVEKVNERYREKTAWDKLGCGYKVLIVMATILIVLHGFMFVGMGSKCLENFSVSGSIMDPLDEHGLGCEGCTGTACLSCGMKHVVKKPYGFALFGIFFSGMFLHIVFVKATERMARLPKGPKDYESLVGS